MPLVRVELPTGKAADYRATMDEAIQKAMHAALKLPLEAAGPRGPCRQPCRHETRELVVRAPRGPTRLKQTSGACLPSRERRDDTMCADLDRPG
jgi:hypothetical protein